jgi:uncharacterized protein
MRGNSNSLFTALLIGVALFAAPALSCAENNDVPASRDYITDTAHVLTPDAIRAIDGWLQELQEKTGAQVKVLTVRTTGGEDFFTFVERQFEHWKLGQAGKSNGALIALAVDDHKVRVHAGYGLEGALPDSWCGSLTREAAATFFRSGQYSDGLVYIVKAVAFRVAQDAGVTLTGIPEQVHRGGGDQQPLSPWASLIFVLVVFLLIYLLNRAQRGGGGRGGRGMWLGAPWLASSGWGTSQGGWSSSSSGWGGSFGGGSDGGGTFGGGSFGGGGSTGGGGGGASW